MKFKFLPKRAPTNPLKRNVTGPSLSFPQRITRIVKNSKLAYQGLIQLFSFICLLILYQVTKQVIPWRFIPARFRTPGEQRVNHFLSVAAKVLGGRRKSTISRIDLIELSFRNMQAKRTRTLITVGGMAIGVGAIVFLVSIGYGLQHLVIARVARLEEMRQADVYAQTGSLVKINDKSMASLADIAQVEAVMPMITAVGRVNFQNSISDMAVFGVTADYLKQSAIKPIHGQIFETNETAYVMPAFSNEDNEAEPVAESDTAEYGVEIGPAEYDITDGEWIRVRTSPDAKSEMIGYTKRTEESASGTEVWGRSYLGGEGAVGTDSEGNQLGKWIKASVPLWTNATCVEATADCGESAYEPLKDDLGQPLYQEGYMAQVEVRKLASASDTIKVLGEMTELSEEESASDSAALNSEESDSLGYVEIASLSAQAENRDVRKITLREQGAKEAIVNVSMLKVLGISESEAVGKTFQASFIITGNLLANNNDRVESNPTSYTIIGVIPDDKTPVFYVPFLDLRQLDVANYTQLKVVTETPDDLAKVRKLIEAQGYVTSSVADTVSQINSLFATLRTLLLLIGTVALAVAALGMFNTLTISLLERTREVGLMKAMGMKSSEVRELFLTESMIMGFYGGVFGIIFGFVAGKTLGLFISIFAVLNGEGMLNITYLPPTFLVVILILSLLVGMLTGIYPAYRTTKISALNALRYE